MQAYTTSEAPPARRLFDDPYRAVAAAFPDDATTQDQLTFMLNWAVRAPSVLNTQPWLFAVDGTLVRVYADRSRQLERLDPMSRELTISCGLALFFLEVAARRFGYAVEFYLQPCAEHPDLLGAMLLAERCTPTADEEALFDAIDAHTTACYSFDDTPLPETTLERLLVAAASEGSSLRAIVDGETKRTLAYLVALALHTQAEDPHLSAEVLSWLRPDGDTRQDGVPERLYSLWDRHAALRISPSRLAAYRRRLMEDAPALLVLATDADDTLAWLQAGRALGRLLRTAALESFQVAYSNQALEVGLLHEELGRLTGDAYPQLLLRVGHTRYRDRTPRRPVRDVLLKAQSQEWTWSAV